MILEKWEERFNKLFTGDGALPLSEHFIKGFIYNELSLARADERDQWFKTEKIRLNKMILNNVTQCVEVVEGFEGVWIKEELIAKIKKCLLPNSLTP